MIKRTLLALLLCCGFMAPLSATEVPDYYPKLFMVFGTLHNINISDGSLTIDDFRLRMTNNLRVYTTTTQFGTVQLLQEGMLLGARPDHQGIVKELWVLPKDYFKPSRTRP